MVTALAFGAYGLLVLLMVRPLAGHFAWSFARADAERLGGNRRPTGEQWFGAHLAALALGLIWPLVLVVLFGGRLLPSLGAERIHEIEERERRLNEMEQELGLTTTG